MRGNIQFKKVVWGIVLLVLAGVALFAGFTWWQQNFLIEKGWEGTSYSLIFSEPGEESLMLTLTDGRFSGAEATVSEDIKQQLLGATIEAEDTGLTGCDAEGACTTFFDFGTSITEPVIFAAQDTMLLLVHPLSGELQGFSFAHSLIDFSSEFSVSLSGFVGLQAVGIASQEESNYILARTDVLKNSGLVTLCMVHIPPQSDGTYVESCVREKIPLELLGKTITIIPENL